MYELVLELSAEEPFTKGILEVEFEFEFDEGKFEEYAKRLLGEEEVPSFEEAEIELIADVASEFPEFVLGGRAIARLHHTVGRHVLEESGAESIEDFVEYLKGLIKGLEELKAKADEIGIVFKSDGHSGFEAELIEEFKPNEALGKVLARIEARAAIFKGIVDEWE